MSDEEIRDVAIGIVGGGPVGMVLALLLAQHGVRSVLYNIDERARWHPKGNTHNARSMEHYRRLGLSEGIRRLGLPYDCPTDVAYFTRFGGHELGRVRMPSEAGRMAIVAASAKTDQVPEPIHRANQMYVETFLFDCVSRAPLITLRFGWRAGAVVQDDDGVSVTAEPVPGGTGERRRFAYVVGCDGGQSLVRRALGIRYHGFDTLDQSFYGGRSTATHLRLPTLLPKVIGRDRRGWMYTVLNPGQRMVLVSLNGDDEFLFFTKAPDPNVPPNDVEICRMVANAAGGDLPIEVLGHNPWTAGAALVAERFGAGRVLLAGDAVHLFTPTGGFGMNTGIDDAANLAWKLAAMVGGWGGAGLLASFEIERKPIAERNTTAAREFAIALGDLPVPTTIEDENAGGAVARRELGRYLEATLVEEFASLGVQLGARYDGSPIVTEDGAPPAFDPFVYTPSGVPGGRAPHLWLDAGRGRGSSLFDRLGLGFTLLCFGDAPPAVGALRQAARARAIPFDIMLLPDADARALYGRDFALLRPDQHIAWRGNTLPADPDRLLARVTGA